MKEFDTKQEFDDYVERLAENNQAHETAGSVANRCIVATELISDDQATMSSAGLYGTTRVYPSEVLRWTLRDCLNPRALPDGFRDAAVVLLRNEIKRAERDAGYRD